MTVPLTAEPVPLADRAFMGDYTPAALVKCEWLHARTRAVPGDASRGAVANELLLLTRSGAA
jgi:hypothetical protein